MLLLFPDDQPAFCSEFSAELETNINTVLCAVQTLVKRRERYICIYELILWEERACVYKWAVDWA